jgi:hypothetical protein
MAGARAWLAAMVVGVVMLATTVLRAADDAVMLPDGTSVACVDFERHVAGLFTRLGCNAGSCHGSRDGQGGFKLSLFGQSPEQDFAAITDADAGRVDLEAPEQSLLLCKPTLQVDHEGGQRLRVDSWEYELLRQWIAGGAGRRPATGNVARLRLAPAEPRALALGESLALVTHAEFADGASEVVTALADFRSHNERVAEVGATGLVTARSYGATAVTISYRNAFATANILVPYPDAPPGEPAGDKPAVVNFIDQEINSQLARLNLTVSPWTDDAGFLRRATLDVLGALPTPDEVRAYTADPDPAKRDRLIARLLADPRRAAWWATRMCDITACNVNTMEEPSAVRPKRAKMWHDWFRRRFAANMPYDQIARGVLCATSRGDEPIDAWIDSAIALEQQAADGFESNYSERADLDLFWRRASADGPVPLEDMAELIGSAFLGLRLHCARCHQHPYDRWSQQDFAAFAKIFAHTHFGSSSELRTAMTARLEQRRQARREGRPTSGAAIPRLQEVFVAASARKLIDAAAAGSTNARPPGVLAFAIGEPPSETPDRGLRQQFFAWLTRADNPYFARNFVNRIWAKYFGRGLVEPVDAIAENNPGVNPRLLDRLAAEFVSSGYDIVHIERLVLSSAAYGRSWRATGNNGAETDQLARWPVRPLPVEALLDAVDSALETRQSYGSDVPAGARAVELAPNRFSDKNVDDTLQLLGRGDRKSLCECDRAAGPTLRQPVFLMTQPNEFAAEGRLARLLGAEANPDDIITEFYLATVSRLADDEERAFAHEHIAAAPDVAAGLADLVWALVNTREFCTNH